MSDSESDNSNGFTYPNVTTVSAKGPNTNISNFSFRNQLTSNMWIPRNFAFDQRSMYYGRETSHMSLHSASEARPRNFQQYYSGMSSQQSVYNQRSGSPMSMRSIGSSASVSAAEIAFAFKNVKYNRHDLKLIKDAYHKLMKQRVRRRIEKRRNMRLFMKGSRRRSGYDSGEVASNSSSSSDDSRLIKSSFKENMSSIRSAKIDLPDFRETVRDSNIVKDCSDILRQNPANNNLFSESRSVNNTNNFNNTIISNHSNTMPTQKERFRSGFLLPTQRFNRSVASLSIPETSENPHKNVENIVINKHKNFVSNVDEEIFSELKESSTCNIEMPRKRSLDNNEEACFPDKKKVKRSSPLKNPTNKSTSKPKSNNEPVNDIERIKNFEFAKPTLPIRKSKPKVQEKVIEELETTQDTDVSMRPSFIKRKLFTQKLDVAEKANLNTDGTNSPQSSTHLPKEKNKTRKLVTNQSCLNREVQDDNNLLDLIHKIVPPDRMNISNQTTTNQTKIDINNKNRQTNEDKWDVTSVISMCNEDDVSDTFTDEEIFEGDTTKKVSKKNKEMNLKCNSKTAVNSTTIMRDCRVTLENLPENNTLQKLAVNKHINFTYNNVSSTNVKGAAKTFWDTDSESDAERSTTLPKSHFIDNVKKANALLEARKENFKNTSGLSRNLCNVSKNSQQTSELSKQFNISMNNTVTNNNTLDSMRKFNPNTLSIRSHRTSKKKKCCNETYATVMKTNLINQTSILIESKKNNYMKENMNFIQEKNIKLVQNKKSTDTSKPKLKTQTEKLPNTEKSTSHNRKNPKVKTFMIDKPDSPKKSNPKNLESKSKPAKLNTTVNNGRKSKPQKKTPVKQSNSKIGRTIPKSGTKIDDQKNMKNTQSKSPKDKQKSKIDRGNNTKTRSVLNNSALQPTILNNSVDPLEVTNSTRPIRSCRSSSQSIGPSRSSRYNNTSDSIRILRSREVDLSSSIENTTIKFNPRKKTKNNKDITIMQTRNSDVSFSLGSGKRTDFLKSKR